MIILSGSGSAAAAALGIADTFNRANNNLSVSPTTSSGHTWIGENGGAVVNNNALIVGGGAAPIAASIQASAADVTIQITLVSGNGSSGIAARLTDYNNCFLLFATSGTYTAIKREAGVNTTLLTFSPGATNGDVLKIVTSGTSIQFYVNNVLKHTETSSFNQTATKHGVFFTSNISTCRFDNFSID